MKRLCIFAHWDIDNVIDDYVIYYLEALKEVCATIIFVSDCNLEPNETNKLNNIADFVIAQKHGEYDFGSYKRGFLFAKENGLHFEELLLVNDSCFGPFYPLKPIFEKMDNKKCDFWGLTGFNKVPVKKLGSYYLKTATESHIQSYFLDLKKSVLNSKKFINFIEGVHRLKDKNEIVLEYEIGLSNLLHDLGFKSEAYMKNVKLNSKNAQEQALETLIKYRYPLLKTNLLKNPYETNFDFIIQQIAENTTYDTSMISKHILRVREKHTKINFYRQLRYKLLKNRSENLRFVVITSEKFLYRVLNLLFFGRLKKF